MYRKVDDFVQEWEKASNGTLKVFESLTDEKLDQAIVEGHNTLGWLGWHLTTAPVYFAGLIGLSVSSPGDPQTVPNSASKIVEGYRTISNELEKAVKESLTDEKLLEYVDKHGTQAPRGELLRDLIDHQTHHRGQMTVLLRQAGLEVPGVMGPTKEDQGK